MAEIDHVRLAIELEARFNRYQRELERAQRNTNQRLNDVEGRFRRFTANVQRSTSGASKALAGVFAGALSARGAQSLIDASIRIQNSLKVVGLEGKALTSVYNELYASAQRNAAPLEALANLYSKVALVQKELKISSAELVGFVDTIAMSLRAGGISAVQASGALTQLAQGLGGGVVRAEEFNSMLEGAPTILQAAAAGIKEAGGSVSALRKIMLEGNLSSEALFRGIEAGAPMIEASLASAGTTIAQSFERVQNALLDAARRFNTSTEASNAFGSALDNLVAYINGVNFDTLIGEIRGYLDWMNAGIRATNDFAAAIGRVTGLDNVGRVLAETGIADAIGATVPGVVNERMAGFEGGRTDYATQAALQRAYADRVPAQSGGRVAPAAAFEPVVPISINDYLPPAGAGKGGAGGSKASERDKAAQAAQREADAVKELIADLEHERSTISATDAERRISDALRQAGAAATDEQKARIGELIGAIEAEKTALEGLEAAQNAVADLAGDALRGIASDLRAGADGATILGHALDGIADKLVNMAIDNLVQSAFGGLGGGGSAPGGSILSAVAGAFGMGGLRLAEGGHVRGPGSSRSDSIPAMLSDGEFVVNAKSAKEHRALLHRINAGAFSLPMMADGGLAGLYPGGGPATAGAGYGEILK